jgi:hypothetical protein
MINSSIFSRLLPAVLFLAGAASLVILVLPAGPAADAQTPDSPPAAAALPAGKTAHPTLDPVLFADWPTPKLALVLTGRLEGYIEPCGCSGKENMQGGLSRRDMLLTKLAADHWPVVALDVGNQVRRFGHQQEIKFGSTAEALKAMDYRAVGLGPNDLQLSSTDLLASIAPTGKQPPMFVSANAAVFAPDPKTLPLYQIIEAGGMKIGVTSVLGNEERAKVNNQDIQLQSADEALKQIMPKLQAEHCDLLVLLAEATKSETTDLAKKFPQFQIVVSSGGAEVPPKQATTLEGTSTQLIELGAKGMYAIVLGLYGGQGPDAIRYQRVPLDSRFGDSARMKRALASYQEQLKEKGLAELGAVPIGHPSGPAFVGSETCGECHTHAYAIWKKTPHATALDTLEHLDPPRQYDPECLSCHVTGWEPQKYFPFTGGYLSLEKTPQLAGNGCENCHGPGANHVAAESGAKKFTQVEQDNFRRQMRLSLKTEDGRRKVIDICLKCHDIDNSLEFKGGEAFDTYWPKVEHPGKD